jgi:hypothetical protein
MVFLLTPDIGEFIEEAKEKSVTAITLLSNRKKLSRAQRRRHPERAACLCGALVRSSRPARLGRHLEWQYARADHAIFPTESCAFLPGPKKQNPQRRARMFQDGYYQVYH